MDVNNTWHYWKQSGHLWTTILVIALFASMTGCHWRAGKEQNVHQAPDRFWKHVQMEMNENTVVFSNDDNSYCITRQEDGDALLTQQQADGTLIQNHKVNQLESVIQASNAFVYYTTWESEAGFPVFWRVPIQKAENGDQLLWEKKEPLLQDYIDISYITDSYAIYEAMNGINKLNLQNGEKTPVMVEDRHLRGSVIGCREQGSVILDGKLFVLEGGSLYSLEPDSAAVQQIYTGEIWKDEDTFYRDAGMVSDEDSIYFTCDNEAVWQYHKGEEQADCVTTEKDFSKKLKKLGLTKKKAFQEYCITEIFLYQERIYFWLKEEKEKQIRSTDAEMCLLSAPVSNLSQLRNESAVTNYLYSWESEATSVDTISDDIAGQEMYLFKPNRMEGVVEDKVILSGIRHLGHGISRVDQEYFAAYDPVSNQILELSDIRKVY